MTQAPEKPSVCVYRNGTLVFNSTAVSLLSLTPGQMMSMYYIGDRETLYVEDSTERGFGVRLEKGKNGSMIAYRAVDYLHEIRPLPSMTVTTPRVLETGPNSTTKVVEINLPRKPMRKRLAGRVPPATTKGGTE